MGAIVASKDRQKTLKDLFHSAQSSIAAVLPKHLTAERILRITLAATSQNPTLLECSPRSILLATLQAAQLGLEPNTPLGLAYLVPHRNKKTGQHEAQFIPGYRGLIRLAVQSGDVVVVHSRVIHARDEYDVAYGLDPKLTHRPYIPACDAKPADCDPGPLVAVYAVAELKTGGKVFEFMSRAQVDAIRHRSKASDGGPWVTDYEEMARKTAIRRLCKSLPLATELLGRALDAQARAEEGEAPDFSEVASALPDAEATAGDLPPPETRTSDLKKRVGEAVAATVDGAGETSS